MSGSGELPMWSGAAVRLFENSRRNPASDSMRRCLSFLSTRLNLGLMNSDDDRLDFVLGSTPVSLIVVDDSRQFGGFVAAHSRLGMEHVADFFDLNSALMPAFGASFAWCPATQVVVLNRIVPDSVLYNEDDLLAYVQETVEVLDAAENSICEMKRESVPSDEVSSVDTLSLSALNVNGI